MGSHDELEDASRPRLASPTGGLGAWIAASLLPVLPFVFTLYARLPEPACYSYQVPGPEVRWRMAILVAAVALSSFVALGLAFGRLRPVYFSRLPRFAVWPLALAAAAAAIGLVLLGGPDQPLSYAVFWLFFLGIPLAAAFFMAIVIAWVFRWSATQINQVLPIFLLTLGALGYPGLLYVVFFARGGAFC